MNILFYENSGAVSYYLDEALSRDGHHVFQAFNFFDAQDIFLNENINCIIVDLNMNPEGMSDEEINKTNDGILTGWIWLQNYVFSKNFNKNRVVIYSEYLEELIEQVPQTELNDIICIDKGGYTSPTKDVLSAVIQINNII